MYEDKFIIILSAERHEYSKEENAKRSADLVEILVGAGLTVIPGEGKYNGITEQAYTVVTEDFLVLPLIAAVAIEQFNQDSVIVYTENIWSKFEGSEKGFTIDFTAEWLDEKPEESIGDYTEVLGKYLVLTEVQND